ncbi:hypothetical protein GCM10009854_27340 [Saccharopolyspora halophila]|uniref:Cell wall anchor protein n=1 Tax=Saccharopolyspora halophila TaxID=405551 RepID=A0ABN3GCA8_9PSEU
MSPLSSDDLHAIREELNAGTTPVVWFTGSAVGVPEGRSGKVIALNEPAEGDFIQVRPASSKDVLSFSVAELTRVKPARKKSAPDPAPAKASTKARADKPAPEAAKPASGAASAPSTVPAAKSQTAAAAKSQTAAAAKSQSAAAAKSQTETTAKPASKPASKPSEAGATRSKSRQSKPAVNGATVTLTADSDGQWSVEVSTPRKRVVKPTQVSANAVQQAARLLHEDVSAAVEPVIEAAREQHRARVEALRAELEAAQAALEELDD